FDRAVRQGVAPGGRRLYPAMPYPSYAKLSDDDVKALYAFFMHGVQPARQANLGSDIPWPLTLRWPIALWNGLFAATTPYTDKAGQDAQWNRGAYIVQGPGHCGSCHTPRGLAFNEKALDDSGKPFLSGA
ncbi:cytochrome c, partial [Acinetobacter pittii]